MEKIDLAVWPRREAFEHFSRVSWPFYSVTFDVDVTEVCRFVKAKGISFYYTMTWLCTRAVSQVEALMLDIRDGEVWRLDERLPSFTDLHPGAEQFHIVTLPMADDPVTFDREARAASEAQRVFLDLSKEGRDLLFISSLPWVRLTGLTHERTPDPEDCVPRIAWGRWTERDGRRTLGLCVEVNHRTVDGLHIGRFAQALEREIDALAL